jgi:hypothetical protein
LATSLIPAAAVEVTWKREREVDVAFWWSNTADPEATAYPRHLLGPTKLYLKANQLLIRCPEGVILIQGALVGTLFNEWCKGEATHIKKGEGIEVVALGKVTQSSEDDDDEEKKKKALPKRPPKKEENDEEDFS